MTKPHVKDGKLVLPIAGQSPALLLNALSGIVDQFGPLSLSVSESDQENCLVIGIHLGTLIQSRQAPVELYNDIERYINTNLL